MRRIRQLIPILIVIIPLLALSSAGSAQSTDYEFFQETGHTVSGPFLTFYQSLKEPLRVLGYPITRQYFDALAQHEVQYFQKGRLDLVGAEVQLAPLGELLYETGAPLAPVSKNSPSCRTFPQTGHSVCFAFAQFYDSFDGEVLLGLPISDIEIREQRYVQYFQNARLEWRPDMPPGHRVVVTDLGRIYFDKVVGNPELAQPYLPSYVPASTLQPQARAFVASPLTTAGAEQTVYVIVQDQFLRPVANASVIVTIQYPGRPAEVLQAAPTNPNGFTTLSFEVGDAPRNEIVDLTITGLVHGEEVRTTSWFRMWW